MKRQAFLYFAVVFVLLAAGLSAQRFLEDRNTPSFSAALLDFRSDFAPAGNKDVLGDLVISRKKKYAAYGRYVSLPPGSYRLTFHIASRTGLAAAVELQVAADRGKTLLASKSIECRLFPHREVLRFKVPTGREVEPRILAVRGGGDTVLTRAAVEQEGRIFPWPDILIRALLLTLFAAPALLAISHALRRSPSWITWLNTALVAAGCALILRRAWISEDAFITLRHVENFLHGLGPVFNPGERVEGFTHPLWFAVVSVFRRLGLPPKGAAVVPGILASFAALYLLFFKVGWGRTSRPAALFNPAAAVLIGISAFIDFGTSGLETALSYLLLVLYAKSIAERKWLDRPFLTGLLAALLVLNRPDFAVFPALLFLAYAAEAAAKRLRAATVFRFLLPLFLLVGGYEVFRMGTYASLLPNPFYAKSGAGAHLVQGWKYLLDLCQGSLCVLIFLAALLMLAAARRSRLPGLRERVLVLASAVVHAAFVVRGGGDFMHGRFLLPALLLIAFSTAGAFDLLIQRGALRRTAAASCALVLFLFSLQVKPLQKRGQVFHHGISDERSFYYKDRIIPLRYLGEDTMILMWKTIGMNYRRLSEQARLNLRVAYKNVGFTGFYAGPHVHVIDELGLADPVVARLVLRERKRPGHEKSAPFGYLMLSRLTFHDTPFPEWNEAARTPYGVLWDLAPRTLRRLGPFIGADFKRNLDERIMEVLEEMEAADLTRLAEFLFFLNEFWAPYAGDEARALFHTLYDPETVRLNSPSLRWIEENREKVESLLSRIQGPLNTRRFLENLRFSLGEGRRLCFSAQKP